MVMKHGGRGPGHISRWTKAAGSSGPSTALALDFTTGSLDARITASGGANGTRVNSSGVIVAATTPRFDYDPVTLAAKGVLVEEARTNLFLNSTIDGANLATQGVATSATPYTISFYGTGTITLTGTSTAGPIVGAGAYPNRQTLTFTPSAGTLTCTVSGTVQYAQIEAGSFATSYIPTAGATVTRTADSLSMTGTDFSSWYNQSEGTWVGVYDTAWGGGAPWGVSDGTTNSESVPYYSGADIFYYVIASAVGQDFLIGTGSGSPKLAVSYASADFAGCVDGGAVASQASGTVPTVSQLDLGHEVGGEYPLNGHILTLDYYNTRLPDATLQSLTT